MFLHQYFGSLIADLVIAEHSWSIRRFTCGSSGLLYVFFFFFRTEGGLEQSLLHRSKPPDASYNQKSMLNMILHQNVHITCAFLRISIIHRAMKGLKNVGLFEVFTGQVVEDNLAYEIPLNGCKYFSLWLLLCPRETQWIISTQHHFANKR